MTIQEFRDYMASGKPVVGGGDVHMMFHKLSQEALQMARTPSLVNGSSSTWVVSSKTKVASPSTRVHS